MRITASGSPSQNRDHRLHHETNLHQNPSAASLPHRPLHETISSHRHHADLLHPRRAPQLRPRGRHLAHEARGGAAEAPRPPLRLNPPTTRLLRPAQKSAPSVSGHRSEVAASVAAAAPARRRPEYDMTNRESKPKPNPVEGDEKPPAEEKSGGGGFVFLCTLAGHSEVISGISLLLGSDKLHSGGADGSVRVWDCNSGKGLRTLIGMHRVGKTPVLFCSLRNSNCIRLCDLPSFNQMDTLLCTKEVRAIELADVGLLFTGDCAGELKVWRWAPQEEAASAAPLESALEHY